MMDVRDLARFLGTYAKAHAAGGFATPPAKDLVAMLNHDPSAVLVWGEPGARTVAVTKRLTRDSRRRDWLGAEFVLRGGTRIVTHLARDPGAPVPDLSDFDAVFTWRDDVELGDALTAQGRAVRAVRISAASELLACWGSPGEARPYPPAELVTVTRIPASIPAPTRAAALRELEAVTGWDDDYPFYSDDSWSQACLRGFWPDEPDRGVKPAEMGKAWAKDHPDDLGRECDWTVLAERCPTLMGLTQHCPIPGARFERVRLMRMDGGPKGTSLGRHTDITDRASGVTPGCIARFHLPLVTDPAVTLHSWDLNGVRRDSHLSAWDWWYLDARKPHGVTNPTDRTRVHLCVDVVADERTASAIVAADRAHRGDS